MSSVEISADPWEIREIPAGDPTRYRGALTRCREILRGEDESVRDPVQSKHQSPASRDSTTSMPPRSPSGRFIPAGSPLSEEPSRRSTRSCPPSDVCHRSRASRVRSGAALDEHEVASASTIHRVTTRLIFRISGHRSVTSHGITRRGPRSGTRAPVGSALVSRTTKTDPRLGLSSFDIRVGDTCS